MTEKKKTSNKDLLFSNDEKVVVKTITNLRESGTDNDLVLLAELYEKNNSDKIKKLIDQFFCDLKNQDSVATIFRLIKSCTHKGTLKMLTSACWQSRLNFIANFELFIDLVIHEDFEISFEAFTLIDNFEEKTTELRKAELINYVKHNIKECKNDNLPLAMDMVKIMDGYKVS